MLEISIKRPDNPTALRRADSFNLRNLVSEYGDYEACEYMRVFPGFKIDIRPKDRKAKKIDLDVVVFLAVAKATLPDTYRFCFTFREKENDSVLVLKTAEDLSEFMELWEDIFSKLFAGLIVTFRTSGGVLEEMAKRTIEKDLEADKIKALM